MPAENMWRVLLVDDEGDTMKDFVDFLEKSTENDVDRLKIQVQTKFEDALLELESKQYDLLILDVRLGPHQATVLEEIGVVTFNSIQQACFIPIIFYTGLPEKVRDLETPIVKVIEKTKGSKVVLATIKEIIGTNIMAVNRAMAKHVRNVQREYMWKFVAENWESFGTNQDKTELAYLLARRLAKSLDDPGIQRLARELGDSRDIWCQENSVHPMRYYIFPPMGNRPMAGDLLLEKAGEKIKYLVLLTPSCDFVQISKLNYVTLACCSLLTEIQEYLEWMSNPNDPKGHNKGNLIQLRTYAIDF